MSEDRTDTTDETQYPTPPDWGLPPEMWGFIWKIDSKTSRPVKMTLTDALENTVADYFRYTCAHAVEYMKEHHCDRAPIFKADGLQDGVSMHLSAPGFLKDNSAKGKIPGYRQVPGNMTLLASEYGAIQTLNEDFTDWPEDKDVENWLHGFLVFGVLQRYEEVKDRIFEAFRAGIYR